MDLPIYFDHNATTPIDPLVLEAMLPYLTTHYGNASSPHTYGRMARQAIDNAREQVADCVNVHPSQVIFTSGGTEANNLFIKGFAQTIKAGQILYSAGEHPCVAKTAQSLEAVGWNVKSIPLTNQGEIHFDELQKLINPFTRIVSIMLAHNETGVINPVSLISENARQTGAWIHTDAVQALGKIKIDFKALNVNAMSLSSHKIYGPKGVGALILDKRLELNPLFHGGGHERNMRSGTENLANIVGFGKACELISYKNYHKINDDLLNYRHQIESKVKSLGGVVFSENAENRLANTIYFAFPNIDGETLVIELDKAGFAVASGSACSSSTRKSSATLSAMHIDSDLAQGAIRVSLGKNNSQQDVSDFLLALDKTINYLKSFTSINKI